MQGVGEGSLTWDFIEKLSCQLKGTFTPATESSARGRHQAARDLTSGALHIFLRLLAIQQFTTHKCYMKIIEQRQGVNKKVNKQYNVKSFRSLL